MHFVWVHEKKFKTALQFHVFMTSVIIHAVMIRDWPDFPDWEQEPCVQVPAQP